MEPTYLDKLISKSKVYDKSDDATTTNKVNNLKTGSNSISNTTGSDDATTTNKVNNLKTGSNSISNTTDPLKGKSANLDDFKSKENSAQGKVIKEKANDNNDKFVNLDKLGSNTTDDKNIIEKDSKDNKENVKIIYDPDKLHLIVKYDGVEIYRVDGEPLLYYKVKVPKPNPGQKLIINTLKEAATRLITIDPYRIRDPLQRKNVYYQKIIEILENAPEINVPKHLFDFYATAVVREMVGYGMLEPLLSDDKLEEIMVVGPKKPTYIYHIDYGMMTTNIIFYSDTEIQDIIDKIARSVGRRVDISSPLLDARLPDGSRVNATVPPASIDGSTITIRKFRKDPYTIVDMINFKTVNLEVAAFLWCAVDGFGIMPANMLITGGTGSGKTTTLNVLASFIPDNERVLTIEDTAELNLPVKHVIRFEGKPPGIEGKGELTLDILTKNTLRMRPDRIIVGEIRHSEAYSLFTAMNTGHDGCMGTVHANSARETLVRLTSPPMSVPMLMLAGLKFIIVQKRINTRKGMIRRIVSIAEVMGVLDNKPTANIIFKWNPQTDNLERTEEPINYFEIIKSQTNLSDLDIKNKIEEKIKILTKLVNNNIRDLYSVAKYIQESYITKK